MCLKELKLRSVFSSVILSSHSLNILFLNLLFKKITWEFELSILLDNICLELKGKSLYFLRHHAAPCATFMFTTLLTEL